MLGNGMAGKGADNMKMDAQYQKEMMERQMNDQPMIPREEWMKMQGM